MSVHTSASCYGAAPEHNPDKLWPIKWKKCHWGLFTDVILSEHSLFNLNKKKTKMFCDSHTVSHRFWKCIRTHKLRQYGCRLIADNIICRAQLCFWQMCFFGFFKTGVPAKNEYFPIHLILLLVDFYIQKCKFAKVKPYFLVFKKETGPHNSRGKKELAWTTVLYVWPLAYFSLSFKNNNSPCKRPRERMSSNTSPKFPLRRLIPHRVPQKVTLAQFKCGISISPLVVDSCVLRLPGDRRSASRWPFLASCWVSEAVGAVHVCGCSSWQLTGPQRWSRQHHSKQVKSVPDGAVTDKDMLSNSK